MRHPVGEVLGQQRDSRRRPLSRLPTRACRPHRPTPGRRAGPAARASSSTRSARAVLTRITPARTVDQPARVDDRWSPGACRVITSDRAASSSGLTGSAPAAGDVGVGRNGSLARTRAAEAAQPGCHATADPAEADDADGETTEFAGPFDRPAAAAHPAVAGRDPAQSGQQQGDGVVGDGPAVGARGVGHHDAAPAGRGRSTASTPTPYRATIRSRGASARCASVTGPVPAIQPSAGASSGASASSRWSAGPRTHRDAVRGQLGNQIARPGGERPGGHQNPQRGRQCRPSWPTAAQAKAGVDAERPSHRSRSARRRSAHPCRSRPPTGSRGRPSRGRRPGTGTPRRRC